MLGPWRKHERGWFGVLAVAGAAVGVAAVAAPNAFAAGGLEWVDTPVPNPNQSAALYDVEALAADDAWAVGGSYAQDAESLVAHWDGGRWTETAHPGAGYFSALDAAAADDVWAVGQGPAAPADHGHTARWDGKEWRTVAGPDLPSDYSYLNDVSALSDGTAWAGGVMTDEPAARADRGLGSSREGAGAWEFTGFVQHWDGSRWVVERPAVPDGAEYVEVTQVHAVSAEEVWVAGMAVTSEDVSLPWVARNTGGEWTNVEIPELDPTEYGNVDAGILPMGDGKLVLAGFVYDGDVPHPMLLSWDGRKLTREDFAATDAGLDAIAADGNGGLVLTGGTGEDMRQPVVMRYRDGDLIAETVPGTGGPGYLAALEAVPETTTMWTVGLTIDDAGRPTGPIAAHTT